jgi:hypothetical protein
MFADVHMCGIIRNRRLLNLFPKPKERFRGNGWTRGRAIHFPLKLLRCEYTPYTSVGNLHTLGDFFVRFSSWMLPLRYTSSIRPVHATVLLVQFRATTADINPSTEGWMCLRDIQCPVCFAVYRLWSLFSDTEQSEINVHIDWLVQHLMILVRTMPPTLKRRNRARRTAKHIGLRKHVPMRFTTPKTQDCEG